MAETAVLISVLVHYDLVVGIGRIITTANCAGT